ncbi:hypothetical protein BDQ94DRAFT_147748 [Aspergillus welwitschiae]|uniref:Uncharacterized protein n=1 Tax=Aspergillus welwitschiae TaxID=1341132 RepID=A0A3F3PVI1_9EURO|nr:hypothetical protein BDQ94DRAFT_147748 [Aspergillus welwitschiae]RDH30937.1 hypothetical protein BDQ94DRAFT_147748 [Aspergillus welwitschiae]
MPKNCHLPCQSDLFVSLLVPGNPCVFGFPWITHQLLLTLAFPGLRVLFASNLLRYM